MQSSLLLTKLMVPPPARHLLHRARLVDALDAGVPGARLVLVLAPAGYGKTTLLADWARQASLPVAWLSAGPEDNDPERFLRYLFTAWETIQPEISDAPPGVLLSGMMPDHNVVMAALVNYATDSASEMALVIDDCHLIDHPDIAAALTYLVDHLPPRVHLVLAGRSAPSSLPLARCRARQETLELGISELEFTPDESRLLLHDTIGLDISDQQLASLTSQLGGWVAGLHLASSALHRDTPVADLAITGRHRFISDFLRDEVLASLPNDTRRFLRQTCIVDRLCGPLANAITGGTNGQETLESLERQHLFTMPLDDHREWYRYHQLLLDYLRQEISQDPDDEVAELHRRAGTWFLDQNLAELAFDHAMTAHDVDLVTQVLERHALTRLFSGQVAILLRWVAAIPDEWMAIEPALGIFRSAVSFATGQMDACFQCLDEVERVIQASDREMPGTQARVTAVRCFVACAQNELERAESLAAIALRTLSPSDDTFRFGVCGALGDTYRRNGLWAQAHENYLLAIEHRDTPASQVQSVHAFGALADLELRQGNLHAAAGYWRKALDVINDHQMWGSYPLPVIGWVYIRLGEILYEQNELDAASDHIAQGRKRAELGGDPRSIIAGSILAARLHLATGELAEADALIEQIEPVVADAQFPEWTSEFARCRVQLWLAQDKLRTAVAWSDSFLARDASAPEPEHENTELAVSHILLIKGDAESSERALSLLDELVELAEAAGRTGILIEALALQSLARWARNSRTGAMTSLEHALRLAEPEGYVRTFVDLGLPMARNLQEARDRDVMPGYVDVLLASFGHVPLPQVHMTGHLPEPLSERELEVLRKMAAGLTNREIAEALFISPETVKKHTGSIYGKLGVRSRMEAVAVARDLDLLD